MPSIKNIVLFTLLAVNLIEQPAPEVKIDQGVLSGKVSGDGTVHEYVGIPYATTEGRFQPPLPPPSWDGVFKAVDEHHQCPQKYSTGVIGTEDCLKINVYVPAHATAPLPVMVYIHGGGFVVGSGGKLVYGADFLVRHDVIVVTFNYRLGALGFLCLGIKEAPGNAGLKDQRAALRWIKKNIGAFGGDPDNVTVFGHSAGAGSISLLIANDDADGLFNRAIIQSGAAVSFWTSMPFGMVAKSVAKHLGFYTADSYELYRIFAEKPLSEILLKTLGEPIIELINANIIHLPCIENKIPGVEAVINDIPYNLLTKKRKNMSIIYGTTDKEGIYLVSEETEDSLRNLNQNNYYSFPDLEFPSKKEAETQSKMIKNYYFGDKMISHETISNLSDLYGDVYLSVPTILESEIMLNNTDAPIYNYYFKYSGGRNMVKARFCKNKDASGASHGDDILYLFNAYIWPYRISDEDHKIIDWMTKMWTNFAKYGDPTPPSAKDIPVKWKPSTKNSLNFLYIDKELRMGPLPHPERYKLWKDIYQKYRKTKF